METDKAQSGSSIGASPRAPMMPADTSLYDMRAEQVAAAAAEGKSRWGTMENEKSANVAGLRQAMDTLDSGIPEALYVPPNYSPPMPTPSAVSGTDEFSMPDDASVFDQRNAQVAAAAQAGRQSRWGSMEVERATNAAGLQQALNQLGPPPGTSSAVKKQPPLPNQSRAPEPMSKPKPPMMGSSPPPVPDQPSASVQPRGTPAPFDPMEQLAREWAAMNQDLDNQPTSYQQEAPPPPPMPQNLAPLSAESLPPFVPSQPSTSVQPRGVPAPEDPMARLAREWTFMNQDSDNYVPQYQQVSPPPPPPPQFDYYEPPMMESMPQEVPPPPNTPIQPKGTPAPEDPMARLAREWTLMNHDSDSYPSQFNQSPPPPPPPPTQPKPKASTSLPPPMKESPAPVLPQLSDPPVQPKGSFGPLDIMKQLAREWSAMNKDTDDKGMAASFSSTQATPGREPLPPPPEPAAPEPVAPPTPAYMTMEDLSREWAARNSDDGTFSTTSSSFVDQSMPAPQSPQAEYPVEPATPPEQEEASNDWMRLAQEWMNTNSDKD